MLRLTPSFFFSLPLSQRAETLFHCGGQSETRERETLVSASVCVCVCVVLSEYVWLGRVGPAMRL